MPINRRDFVLSSAALAAVGTCGPSMAQTRGPSLRQAPATGTRSLEVTASEGVMEVKSASNGGKALPIWGFNGRSPGPVLRIRHGQELLVRLRNKLPQATSMHWRGVRGPNSMDGVAGLTQPPVAPDGAFEYRLAPPDAGTFLYHAHPAANRAEQVHRGLSGILIVEEDRPPEADEDLVFAIADWRLGPNGVLAEPANDPSDAHGPGRLGGLFTINGIVTPVARTARPGTRIRFRIVNLCPARIVALTFTGTQPSVAAIDGQPCRIFNPADRTIPAAPGARFDVFADIPEKEGEALRIILRTWPLAGLPAEPAREIYVVRAAGAARGKRNPPEGLNENPALPEAIALQDAQRISMALARNPVASSGDGLAWTINGQAHPQLPGEPLFAAKRDQPVTLAFSNRDRFPQVMRIHGHAVRLLHRLDDGWDPYWRDAVIVPPGETVRVAFVADNPGKWLIASGIHAHANAGLAHWFEIT